MSKLLNGKVILSGCLCIVSLGLLGYTQFALPNTPTEIARYEKSKSDKLRIEFNQKSFEDNLKTNVISFNENRKFEISYTDVSSILKVLEGVKIVEVKACYELDASNNFNEIKPYVEGDSPNAVKFELLTNDFSALLGTLNKMELPVYSITYEAPNDVSLIFLTGGEV